ncbi:MAG TPA: glycoside hydrolase family 27 protein [Nocardioides sp.]|uniref:glycoside hydrolase family 27 protein n=1 Tax=Nocardioides sp. TaxID=35761 RepID=UPI002E347F21|nr:glycoside hydrolase family 27 protein [Nocardioides sp.]HEX3930911.1 glycoside hydrolase family 27 protein [Nocardioides sp.]
MRVPVVIELMAMVGAALAGVGTAQAATSHTPASAVSAPATQQAVKTPKLAATPPMGWNSWDAYACDSGARNLEAVARFIHDSGLEKDGYSYVNQDGCYDDLEGLASPNTYGVTDPTPQDPETCGAVNGRLPDGSLYLNSYAYPPSRPCADDGFAVVSHYLHGLGLKMGVYYDASNSWNCEEIPGSYGFDDVDARNLARWGVDYVKLDWGCSDTTVPPGSNAPTGYVGIDAAPGNQGFGGPTFAANPAYDTDQQTTQTTMYTAMVDAIRAQAPHTVVSIAGAGTTGSEQWGLPMAQLDRPTGDANANFTATGKHAAGSVVGLVNADATTYDALTGPGHWVDPDPMEVGNGSLTADEDRSEMSMFSEMAMPLLMSTNLCPGSCGPDTTAATQDQLALDVSVFGNKRVIAVDQDPLGSPAHVVGTFDGTHLEMAKPLANGDLAVTLFNESATDAATMTASPADLGLAAGSYRVQDLWSGETTTSDGTVEADVPATATAMFRISPVSRSGHASHTSGLSTSTTPSVPDAVAYPSDPTATYRGPGNLVSVSCPTSAACAAVDNQGRLVTFDPSTPGRSVRQSLDPDSSLVSVSCPGSRCTALDSEGVATTFTLGRRGAEHASRRVVDAGRQPTAVDCATATQCTVVDGSGNAVTFDPASSRPHPSVAAVDPDTYLDAVDCPSASQCTAVGGGGNSGDTEVTFDPTSGQIGAAGVTAVDPATGNGVSSVSCPSTTQCTVVDGSGNETTFDPTTGATAGAGVTALEGDALAAGLGVLTSVDCPTTTTCAAVDLSGDEVGFDPTTGAVSAAGLIALDPEGNGLESVSCPTAAAALHCTAVDLDGQAISFDPTTGSVGSPGVATVDARRRR